MHAIRRNSEPLLLHTCFFIVFLSTRNTLVASEELRVERGTMRTNQEAVEVPEYANVAQQASKEEEQGNAEEFYRSKRNEIQSSQEGSFELDSLLKKYLPQEAFTSQAQERVKKETHTTGYNQGQMGFTDTTNPAEDLFKSLDPYPYLTESLHLHIPIILDSVSHEMEQDLGDVSSIYTLNANLKPMFVDNTREGKRRRVKRSSPVLDELNIQEVLQRNPDSNQNSEPENHNIKRSVSYKTFADVFDSSLLMDHDDFQESYVRKERSPGLFQQEKQDVKAFEQRNSGYMFPTFTDSITTGGRVKRSIAPFSPDLGTPTPKEKFGSVKHKRLPWSDADVDYSKAKLKVQLENRVPLLLQVRPIDRAFILSQSPQSSTSRLMEELLKEEFLGGLRVRMRYNWIRNILFKDQGYKYKSHENLHRSSSSDNDKHIVPGRRVPANTLKYHADIGSENGHKQLRVRKKRSRQEGTESAHPSGNLVPLVKLYFKIVSQQCQWFTISDSLESLQYDILTILNHVSTLKNFPISSPIVHLLSETYFNELLQCSSEIFPTPIHQYKSYLPMSSPLIFPQFYPNLISSNEIEQGEPVTRSKRTKRSSSSTQPQPESVIFTLQRVTHAMSKILDHVHGICQRYVIIALSPLVSQVFQSLISGAGRIPFQGELTLVSDGKVEILLQELQACSRK